MKKFRGIYLLYLFCALCNALFSGAQQIPLHKLHIRHITSRDGLLFTNIECFLQDSRQFIWMAGKALQRYDGYRFKNYFSGAEQIVTHSLFEDRAQTIWAGTSNGVYRLNRLTDRFELFQDSLQIGEKKHPLLVYSITDDGSGRVWFSLLNSNAYFNSTTGRIESAAAIRGFGAGKHPFITRDEAGNLWVRNSNTYGITRYNWRSQTFTTHENNPGKEPVFDIPVKDVFVYPDRNGNTWFTGSFDNRLLYRYNDVEKKLHTYRLAYPPGHAREALAVPGKIIISRQGAVWVQLHEHLGVARYNPETDSFEYLYTDNDKKNALRDAPALTNGSNDFYEDHQGNFWYGGNAVSMFSPGKQIFQTIKTTDYLSQKEAPSPLNSSPTTFLSLPDGKIYIGFYGDGLWQFGRDMQPERKIVLPPYANPLIWNIFSPDGERIFVADQLQQLLVYDTRKKTWQTVPEKTRPHFHISTSFTEPGGVVWLGCFQGGLYKYQPQTGQGTDIRHLFINKQDSVKRVNALLPENDDQLWLGAKNGLHRFSKKTEQLTYSFYPNAGNQEDQLNCIYHISRLNTDTLLLSTGRGFIIFNTKNNNATVLNMKNGLPDNACFSSLPENNRQYVWINTQNKGVCRLNLRTLRAVSFTDNDGVENPGGDLGCFVLPDGRFIFSNVNGFSLFHPDSLGAPLPHPQPVITGLLVNGQEINTETSLGNVTKLRLGRHENTLAVFFSALDYFNNEKITYAVKLAGADTGWVFMGRNPQVEYRNLAPGKYVLHIKCNSEYGHETEAVTTLQFTIVPPFWKRGWFYLLCFLALALLGYLLYRFRVYAIRKEEQLKSDYRQKMTELEIKALRSQMNPHFIFNSLNAINRYILKNDKHEASAYLTKFSKLVRMILDHSRQPKIPLSQELDALRLYLELECLRFQNNFSYTITLNENISAGAMLIPPMVIQPFAENAIWHGLLPKQGDCRLEIDLSGNGNRLLCRVEDNGIGRKESAVLKTQQSVKRTSLGIDATEQRLHLITEQHKNASVTIEDLYTAQGEPAGTRVWIQIPYSFS